MVHRAMERALAGIRPDEIQDVLEMVALWERAGWIARDEAAEWSRLILASGRPLESAAARPLPAAVAD